MKRNKNSLNLYQKKRKKSLSKVTDFGRSMVEMLGVLVMIGLIGITSIMGFRYGMNVYKAYRIQETATQIRSLVEASQITTEDRAVVFLKRTPMRGYGVNVSEIDVADKYSIFRIELNDVPTGVQRLVYAQKENYAKMGILVVPTSKISDTITKQDWINAGLNNDEFELLFHATSSGHNDNRLIYAFINNSRGHNDIPRQFIPSVNESECPAGRPYLYEGNCYVCDPAADQHWENGRGCVSNNCTDGQKWNYLTGKCVNIEKNESTCPAGMCGEKCDVPCITGGSCAYPRTTIGGMCVCPSPKTDWDEENNKCLCPRGTYEKGNECVGCLNNKHCTSTPDTPVCSSTNNCGPCPPNKPVWNGSNCEACTAKSPGWDGTKCVSCYELDRDKPYWNGEVCVACINHEQCPADMPKCNNNNVCEKCSLETPLWKEDKCVTCYEGNKNTPRWNGMKCQACPPSTPQWNTATNECTPCSEATPKWNGEKCITCVEADSNFPFWNGQNCTACPASLPKWNGQSCVKCASFDSEKPYWNGEKCVECPQKTRFWNGTTCVECLDHDVCPETQPNCAAGVCMECPPGAPIWKDGVCQSCPSERPIWDGEDCFECLEHTDCPLEKPRCSAEFVCEACNQEREKWDAVSGQCICKSGRYGENCIECVGSSKVWDDVNGKCVCEGQHVMDDDGDCVSCFAKDPTKPYYDDDEKTCRSCNSNQYWNTHDNMCKVIDYECRSNADCNKNGAMGYYCYMEQGNSCSVEFDDVAGSNRYSGKCVKAEGDVLTPYEATVYTASNKRMTWWSAQRFCEAFGQELVDLSYYQCADEITGDNQYCHEKADNNTEYNVANIAGLVNYLNDIYETQYNTWTANSVGDSCHAYGISWGKGHIFNAAQGGLSVVEGGEGKEAEEVNNIAFCKCPAANPLWDTQTKSCLSACPEDRKYYDTYSHSCVASCPNNRPFYDKTTQTCLRSCPEKRPYFDETSQNCLEKCPSVRPVYNEKKYTCEESNYGKACFSNVECGNNGLYCYIEGVTHSEARELASNCREKEAGTCRYVLSDAVDKGDGVIISEKPVTWYTAQRFCAALNKNMMTYSTYDKYSSEKLANEILWSASDATNDGSNCKAEILQPTSGYCPFCYKIHDKNDSPSSTTPKAGCI